jgi:hypothetical protein
MKHEHFKMQDIHLILATNPIYQPHIFIYTDKPISAIIL